MTQVYINSDCQFIKDLCTKTTDGANVNRGVYNLIINKRDLSLYIKHGIKPHRRWKITPVKKYFGLKGSGETLLNRFLDLHEVIMDEVNNGM